MKLRTRSMLLAAVGTIAAGCGASPEPQAMTPAAAFVPEVEREVNLTVRYGDELIEIDDALVVEDQSGRRYLMLFDGDAACDRAWRVEGIPRGLVLQAELDANGQPTNWSFYHGGVMRSLELGPDQARYRSGPGGGSLAIRTLYDEIPLEIRGSYQPDYCR